MIELALIVIAAIAVLVGAILRPFIGRWIDERNIERLRLRYSLDRPTAERLYQLARRDGFGSAWKTVIEGPPEVAAETGKTGAPRRTRPTARTRRSLADRHRA
jgi:hypothetical protein